MKKVNISRIFSLTLLLLLLVCGSSWAANFSFTDHAGQWWSGRNFSITFDWSAGPLSVTSVGGDLYQNGIAGDVVVSLNTDILLKSYSLDASAIRNASDDHGPTISVVDNPFLFYNKVLPNGSDAFFVAWDFPIESSKTLMLYFGDQNCYTYLGLDFSDDLVLSLTTSTSMTFTASSVEAIVGQHNCVPIPAAIWLLSSGLFGLVCIRRKNKI
jgi:hypothetical protein